MTCWRACGVASVDFPASAFWISISLLPAWPSQCILWHASKTVLDVRLYVLGEEVARVTLDGGAISPNQELLKVPGYVGPPHWFPDQEVGAKTFLRSISGWRVSPTSPSGFLSRQKGQAATSWGMWRGDVHSLHSPPPVQTKMISPKKKKVFGSANIIFTTKKIQNGKKQNWRIRSTLSNMSPLNSKPLPGLTCFSRLTISSPPPFSCSASALIKLIVNQSSCGQQPSEQNNVVELILEGKGLVSINPCHEI